MNSQRHVSVVFVRFLFALVTCVTVLTLLIGGMSNSARVRLSLQANEKSLDVDRYPDEPLELVDLRIREKSVKAEIKPKLRDSISKWGKDKVRFSEDANWFRHVKVTLRNASGRPIYGLIARLAFKPADQEILFGMALTHKKDLRRKPLQPNEEIELDVSEETFNRSMSRMLQHGVDANSAVVSLSVDSAMFADDLMWSRGDLMQRDPNNHRKWDKVEKPKPNGASQLKKQAGFTLITFTSSVQQIANRCQSGRTTNLNYQCASDYDDCVRIIEVGTGSAGFLSALPFVDDCIDLFGTVACLTEATHYTLQIDSSCPPPSPTPTPLSCIPDGWTYLGYTPCCTGPVEVGEDCGSAPTPTPDTGPTPDRCAFIAPPNCPPGQIWIRGTYPFCYNCINNPFPSFSPTPTPTFPLPNGSVCFSNNACQSGYCSPSFQCETPPSATPTPLFRLPNGSICFSNDVCQSGFCNSSFQCANPPGPTPVPTPLPNGSFCFDDSECQSYYCEFFTCADWDWGGGPGGDGDWCAWSDCSCWSDWECSTFCDWDGFCAWWFWLDPIVIDVNGDGFEMTAADNGVTFEFFGRGVRRRISWTAAGADDAWLVLDRNRNGTIDTAKEMFSNVSPQPSPPSGELPIGFASLAEYDKAAHGGNGDGLIDGKDRIFRNLRLWQDANHNGVSELTELHSLPELGVQAISVDYKESQRTDRWGNSFRYRAKVYGATRKDLGRWAYDVVLFTSKPERGRK